MFYCKHFSAFLTPVLLSPVLIELMLSLDYQCGPTDVCQDPNAECRFGFCRCREGFNADNGVCTSAGRLNSPCLSGGRCLEDRAMCEAGTCRCRQQYFMKDGNCGMYCVICELYNVLKVKSLTISVRLWAW